MFLKSWMGWLPSFHPYEDIQQALSGLVGGAVSPAIPSALSFLNGAVVLGIPFVRLYRVLPGRSKRVHLRLHGDGRLLFPVLDQGPFTAQAGLGARPALFSLAVLLTCSMIMGIAYATLGWKNDGGADFS